MIILDTNVISELMRPRPEPRVMRWLAAQPIQMLATTVITLAEIGVGLARLPEGRRRTDLEAKFRTFVARGLGPRVFAFDATAAEAYGRIVAARERIGRPLNGFDGLIASIARAHAASIATRNTADFDGCGLRLVDPWADEPEAC